MSGLSALGVKPPPSAPPVVALDAPPPSGHSNGDVARQARLIRPEPAPSLLQLTNGELLVLRISAYVKTRRVLLALCVLATGVWTGAVGAAVAVAAAWVIERALSNPTRLLQLPMLSVDPNRMRDILNHWQERYGHLPQSTQRELLDEIDEVDAFEELELEIAQVRLPLCESMNDPWLNRWEDPEVGFGDSDILTQISLLTLAIRSAETKGNQPFATQLIALRSKILG